MKKTQIKNVVGQIVESLLSCNIKKNVSHHHMSMIAGTHTNEDYLKNL